MYINSLNTTRTRCFLIKNTPLYCLIFTLLFSGCGYASPSITERKDVQAFIEKMVGDHNFKREDLINLFNKVRLKDGIIRAMTRPAESKPWHAYRKIFITDRQINGGVSFWQNNASALADAEAQYGVPPEIIVAIIGIETRYGRNAGSYRVIDALSTLAFDYPKRAQFFTEELEQFLLLCREENINPLSPIGSYAGAMGIPQFMPSSYRKYAKDQEGDGQRDIWQSNRDAIASVANYFTEHGWVRGDLVTFPAITQGNNFTKLLSKGLKPDTTLSIMQASGINIPPNLDINQKSKLLKLDNEEGPRYWVTLPNFYVITRYNHSSLYAMAVYQLSREILHKKG